MAAQKPLRVAYLYQSSGASMAGHEAPQVHIYHTLSGLQRRGHHAVLMYNAAARRVVCTADLPAMRGDACGPEHWAHLGLSGWPPLLRLESGVRRLQRTLRLPYLALFDTWRMFAACRRHLAGYDLLHERYNLLGLGGTWAARRMNVPLVVEVNGDMLSELDYQGVPWGGWRREYARWSTARTFAAARKIIAVTPGLKAQLVRAYGVPDDKIAVLPNAADVQLFGASFDRAAIRRRLGLSDELVVMFVGRFYRWHGLELLIQSFAQVAARLPRARLVLVGDGETRPAVELQVHTLGLDRAVLFAGVVPHEQVPAQLAIADLAVAPWQQLGWDLAPLKLFEYMAAGKAIVACEAGGIGQVIAHGVNGYLVRPDDATELAEAIVRLLQDPAERDRLGQNARRQAVEQHSWERYVERLEEIYTMVLDTGD